MKKLNLYLILFLFNPMLSGCSSDTTLGDVMSQINMNRLMLGIAFVVFLDWIAFKEARDPTGKISKIIDFFEKIFIIGFVLYGVHFFSRILN